MGTPFGAHYIRLAGSGGHTGRRTATHDIDNNAGGLGDACIADQFLLKGKTRTGGGGQYLGTGERRTDNGSHGTDLIFHLHKFSANFRQLYRHNLGNLG